MSQASKESTVPKAHVGIIGGAGHVGLPLGLSFARAGLDVVLFDVNEASIETLRAGEVPFLEHGAEELLREHLGRRIHLSSDPRCLSEVDNVVCVIGTPIDEHLNPKFDGLLRAIDAIRRYLRSDQLFILRSTVFPGATSQISAHLEQHLPGIDVAFCPERVVQGRAIEEISSMPQIISGINERSLSRARELFAKISPSTIELEPLEAELAKLFCNSWRYVTFAVANQFYAMCAKSDIDYYTIWDAMTRDYPRLQGLPKAGFAAGPCLFKDTMQLSAFFAEAFPFGHSAMLVNENLPGTIIELLDKKIGIAGKTIAILGMAFKGDNDDIRESLAFKLRKQLKLRCREVVCSDEFASLPWFVPMDEAIARADAVVIGAPHSRYKSLQLTKPFIDPWNILGAGGLPKVPEPA